MDAVFTPRSPPSSDDHHERVLFPITPSDSPSSIGSISLPPFGRESPSQLACSPHFSTWAIAANLIFTDAPSVNSKSMFTKLNQFKLPKSLINSQSAFKLLGEKEFYMTLNTWAALNPAFLQDDDVHDIAALSQALCDAYLNIRLSKEAEGTECIQRRGVDQMIRHAFGSRVVSKHKVFLKYACAVLTHPLLSEWVGDDIESHHKWKLDNPIEFLQCYSFLCNLANDENVLRCFDGLDDDKVVQSLTNSRWRAVSPPSKAKSNKRQRSVGSANHAINEAGVSDGNADAVEGLGLFCEPFELRRGEGSYITEFGLPLETQYVKLHDERMDAVYDRDEGLMLVEEWRLPI